MNREDPVALQETIRACRICRDTPSGPPLPIEPNPILVLSATARLLVAGQAPGNLADKSSKPFNDPSGVRLRDWMGVTPEVFYDPARIAIVPMGFCFPGNDAHGGDRPPRRECRAAWHERVMASMPQVELILAIGHHAQRFHHALARQLSLTDTVAAWRTILGQRPDGRPAVLPLPHPSWRNNGWIRRHPWFSEDLLPELKQRVADLV
ncbi:uracil-DNA glycosylase family protein [Antarcticirhabdus aurantiaca]|uniref:Uracil-DNA glycosylase family protein n=1 Tax=Antarcticirhabdus aurantiaca TaxID=2606717 RepID=A0ACD4NV07_9HYPH|nr:uracil-DNA glycosylase family protein [Antarcticirhabdus aurantiaca]WAJ30598.1 uracil-DNA glycosylase family protein [Jeongeuplla avenae]